MNQKIEQLFLPIIVLCLCLSLSCPQLFIGLKLWIPIALGIIIFSIGLNVSTSSLKPILYRPKSILSLIVLRYIVMPFTAFFLAKLCHLTPVDTLGLVILSAAPGGASANVMAYLSGSNVAMTVLLTFGTTILCPLLTPLLIFGFFHHEIHINFWGILFHVVSLVFLPVVAGIILNTLKLPIIEKIKIWMPTLAIIVIGLVIACICALNQAALVKVPTMLILAVLILNLSGYAMGSSFASLLGWEKVSVAAVAFDYGMFDGVVAISICTTFFSMETAVPTVLMSVIQSLSALLLVRWLKPPKLVPDIQTS